MQSQFKSILTYRDLDEYLEYEYLGCPCSGLKRKKTKLFPFYTHIPLINVKFAMKEPDLSPKQ